MGDLRLTSRLRALSALTWSRIGYAAGCGTTAAGVGVSFGLGWGLTVAGALCAASCLLLVDVEPKEAPADE